MSLPSRWLMVWLQSFRSSETRATLWWLLCRQSICSVISLHSGMSGFTFHLSLSVASSMNLSGSWHVWSDCHLLRQSSERHGWLLPPPLWSWRLRSCRLHCLHGWWLHLHLDNGGGSSCPCLVFGDWAISVHYQILLFAVFLNEKLDLCLQVACWPFSGRSVWQRCHDQPGYLSHSLVCPSSVSWHSCNTESSAWPSGSLWAFHDFKEWGVGIFNSTQVCFDPLPFLSGLHWWEVLHEPRVNGCVFSGSLYTLTCTASFSTLYSSVQCHSQRTENP